MHALVGKLLGIDLKEGTPLGEMLARMLGLELEMEPGEEKGTLDLEMELEGMLLPLLLLRLP